MQKLIDKVNHLKSFCSGAKIVNSYEGSHFDNLLECIIDELEQISYELEDSVPPNFPEVPVSNEIKQEQKDYLSTFVGLEKTLSTSIRELPLLRRTITTIFAEKIRTLQDIIDKSAINLLKVPNFGRKSLADVTQYLKSQNLSLKGE